MGEFLFVYEWFVFMKNLLCMVVFALFISEQLLPVLFRESLSAGETVVISAEGLFLLNLGHLGKRR